MSISDSTIQGAVSRYQREYDRYLKLCARVAEVCRLEIVEGNAIRAQVTSRAKSPKIAKHVVKSQQIAASGGPARVPWIAERFLEIEESRKSKTDA